MRCFCQNLTFHETNTLEKSKSDWPIYYDINDKSDDESDKIEQEILKYYQKSFLTLVLRKLNVKNKDYNPFDKLIYSYSTLQKLVRVTARIPQWPKDCSKLKIKEIRKSTSTEGGSGERKITSSEYQDALKFFIYFDQKQRLDLKKNSQLVTRKVKVQLTNIDLK